MGKQIIEVQPVIDKSGLDAFEKYASEVLRDIQRTADSQLKEAIKTEGGIGKESSDIIQKSGKIIVENFKAVQNEIKKINDEISRQEEALSKKALTVQSLKKGRMGKQASVSLEQSYVMQERTYRSNQLKKSGVKPALANNQVYSPEQIASVSLSAKDVAQIRKKAEAVVLKDYQKKIDESVKSRKAQRDSLVKSFGSGAKKYVPLSTEESLEMEQLMSSTSLDKKSARKLESFKKRKQNASAIEREVQAVFGEKATQLLSSLSSLEEIIAREEQEFIKQISNTAQAKKGYSSRKAGAVVASPRKQTSFERNFKKLPDSMKSAKTVEDVTREAEKFIMQSGNSDKNSQSMLNNFKRLIGELESKKGSSATIKEIQTLTESIVNEQLAKTTVRDSSRRNDKTTYGSLGRGYVPTFITDDGGIVSSFVRDQDGIVSPRETAKFYGDVLKNKDNIGGVGDLSGKSLYSINEVVSKLGDVMKQTPKGNERDAISRFITEITKYIGGITDIARKAEDSTETQINPAQQKLISQIDGSESYGDSRSGLYSVLRTKRGIDAFGFASDYNEAREIMGPKYTEDDSDTYYKEKEDREKYGTGYTGEITQGEQMAQQILEVINSPEFFESFKKAFQSGGSAAAMQYLKDINDSVIASIDPSSDGKEKGVYSSHYDSGFYDKDYGIDAKTEAFEGAQQSQKLRDKTLSLEKQNWGKMLPVIERLLAETTGESAQEQVKSMLEQALTRSGKKQIVNVDQVTNMSANRLSNFLTTGKMQMANWRRYSEDTGMSLEDVVRQNGQNLSVEFERKIQESIEANKILDSLLSSVANKFRQGISTITTDKDSSLESIAAMAKDGTLTDENFYGGLQGYLDIRNSYALEIEEFDKAKKHHKKLPFKKKDRDAKQQYIDAFDSSFQTLTQGFSGAKGIDGELNDIFKSIQIFSKDYNAFAQFMSKFYGETYTIGARSFNKATPKEDGIDYSKLPKSPYAKDFGESSPKERFLTNQGYDYMLNYGATQEEALVNAQKLLAQKQAVLASTSTDAARTAAQETIAKIDAERAEAEAVIESISQKYPSKIDRFGNTHIQWSKATFPAYDYTKREVSEDKKAYAKARKTLGNIKKDGVYSDAQSVLTQTSASNDVLKREIDVISYDIEYMKLRKAKLEELRGVVAPNTGFSLVGSPYTPNGQTKTNTLQQTEQPIETIEAEIVNENNSLMQLNSQYSQHSQAVLGAVEAEAAKLLISKQLASQLLKEEQSTESTTDSMQEHTAIINEEIEATESLAAKREAARKAGELLSESGNIKVRGFIPAYDEATHTYYDEQGNKIISATQSKNLLKGGGSQANQEDYRLFARTVEGLATGAKLTIDNPALGIGINPNDVASSARTYASVEIGNVFHEAIEAMAKTGATSFADLQTKDIWKNGLESSLQGRIANINKVSEFSDLAKNYDMAALEKRLNSLMQAAQKMGLTLTQFTEIPLGFEMSGEKGSFKIGTTLDQLYSGALDEITGLRQAVYVDNKTGHINQDEGYQLSLEAMAGKAIKTAYNADKQGFLDNLTHQQLGLKGKFGVDYTQKEVDEAKQNMKKNLDMLDTIDFSNVKTKIAHVTEQGTELLDYIQLSFEQLYTILQDAYGISKGERGPYSPQEYQQLKTARKFGTVASDEAGGVPNMAPASKQSNKLINSYISNYNQQMRVEERLQKANYDLNGKKGDALISQQSAVKALEQQLNLIKAQAPQLDLVNGTLNGQKLTQQEIDALLQRRSLADAQHLSNQARINAAQKQQVGFFGKLVGGLKNQMAMFIDTSLAYQAIGKIRQAITTLINTTKELDSALVDIQIATGNTRQETRALLITYSDLAKEMGRTTQNVAQASNDWLRAGYEGQEAAELTRASMMLSTLGMIEATEATTYLISTLKGWKISANEVIDVVDKLTAVDMAAAISAGDLALAMSRANNSARVAGSDMNKFIGYVTTVADVTQKSAESVGESFKTIYSRFGNVKANKYVATTADMNEADYNSDEFENLNDIETVLTKQGIRLRETAGTWRDIDTVIEEIATKWKTWDQTTKSAVATVVAGTRQRENVITLFENWDDVAKYAEIAENAYGTATSKMEAYTESVEASRQRLTVAVEQWALKLNQSDALKAFYDGLTFLVENIHTVSLTLLGIASFANFEKVATTFSSGLMNLSSKVMGLGNVFGGIKNTRGKVTWGSFSGGIEAGLNQSHLLAQQEAYGRQLDSYTKVLGQQQVQSVKLMQTELLRMDAESKKTMATILSSNMNEMEAQKLIETMSAKDRVILAETLLTQEIMATSSFTKEEARQRIEAIAASNGLELSEEELMAVTEQLIAQRRKMGATASGAVSTNLKASSTSSAKTQLLGGVASIGGMLLGSLGGSGAVEMVSEGIFGKEISDTGKTLGTLIGGAAGSYAGSALISGIASGASLGSLAGPIGIIAGLLGGVIYSGIKKHQQKLIKEAQEDFKELEQKYTESKSLTTVAAKFDELSKGVDSFGRNVSLSEDEYQSFLDCSNQLVDAFPQLLSYTDAEGNSIAIMGSEAQTTSEYVETLIKDMQKLADQKMIVPEVMGEALKNAQKEFEDTYDKVYGHEILGFGDTVEEKAAQAQAFLSGAPITQDGYLSKSDIEGMVQLPHSNVGAYDMSLTDNLDNYFEKFANSDGKISMDDYYYYQDYITKYQALMGAEALRDNESFTLDTLRESGYTEAAIALIQEAYDGWGVQIGEWNNNIWGSLSTLSDEAFQKLYLHDSNTKDFQPEFSSNVAKDFLTQYNNLQANINNINNSMADYALAYARTQGIFDGLDEEQSIVMKQALSGINVAKVDDEGNVVKLTQEQYQDAIRDVANGVNDLFNGDNNIIEIALKLDEAETTYDFELARGELRKALVETFGADGFSEDEMKIMIAYGFEHDGSDDFDTNNFTDTKSRLQQVADALGVSKYSLPATDWGIYDMSEDEFKNFYELASSGAVRVGDWQTDDYGDKYGYSEPYRVNGTSGETVQNLMRSQNAGSDIITASQYSSSLLSGYGTFANDLETYYNSIKDSYNSVDEYSKDAAFSVAENFSHLPQFMREAIVQGGEAIISGQEDIADQVADQMKNYEQAIVNSQVNIATVMAKDQFSGIELDGYIDSWSELQQAIEQVANSYEKLKSAQEEQDATGRLSWQTTLDLLTTNMDYVNALEIGADGIRLKTNAESIMMGVQIATIQANIDAAIAEKQLEIQSLRTAIQEAKSGQVTVTSTNANIDAHNAEIQSLNALAQAFAQVANLRVAAMTGSMGDFSATEIEASLEKVTYTGAELSSLVETWKEQAGAFDEATGTWSEGSLHQDIKVLENLKGDLQTLVDSGYSAEVWESNFNTPDLSGGDVKDEFEKLKDLMGALNKEFHQMLAYADEGMRSLEGTAKKMHEAFYEVKAQLLDRAIARGEVLLGGRSLEDIYKMKNDEDFDKYLGYYTELQDLYVERNNLDDEEIEDKIKIAELEGASLTTMKDIQQILIGTSDTYYEKLQRQKDYNSLLDEEYRLTAANRDLLDKTLYGREGFKEGKSLSDTSYYTDLKDQIQSEIDAINNILENDKNPTTKAKLSAEEISKYKAQIIGLENELALVESTRLEDLQDQQKDEGTSIARRKALQQELIASASTYEKQLQYQKEYNNLLDEEYQIIKANRDVISQEAYMREQFGNNKGGILDTTYYNDMFAQIEAEKKAIQNILNNNALEANKAKLTEKEILNYQGELVKLDNEKASIMDEYLNKLKEEQENQKSSLDIRKDLQKELINSADTYEELLQRQQEYNDLLKEEQDLRESIASSLNDEYLAMEAFQSGGQTNFYNLKGQALKDVQDAIDTRIMNNKFATGEIVPVQALESGNAPEGLRIGTYVSTSDGRIYEIVGIGQNAFGSLEKGYEKGYNYNPTNSYWSKETDYIANGTPLSDSDYVSLIADQQNNYVDRQNLDDERIQHQINLLKGQKADLSAVTAQYKQLIETADTEEEFYDYYQQYLDAFIAEFDDKISDIQRQIDDLQKARPQEWKSTLDNNGKVITSAESKIKSYYSKMDTYYNNQLSSAKAALRYSSELTEEEIEHLVDTANDAIKNIHDNAIAQAEDIKAYQESVYSALTNEVQRYIDDLEKQKEIVEETYDKELEKLQDKEDAIARTNKLIELQNNLLNAQKEKERVYREGIGWTYETNREKVRTAENELNDFYRQDRIDDLNNAKDQELQNLDEHIKNWEDYLAMLNEKYNEYAILEEKRLLKELLNVETDAQIKAAIVADMTKFTTEISLNYDTFIENQSLFYQNYNSTFSAFLSEYSANLANLAALKAQELSLLNMSSFSMANLGVLAGASGPKKNTEIEFTGTPHDWATDTTDYSALAMKSTSIAEIQHWLGQRTNKAEAQNLDISGNTEGYRSNDQVYQDWLDATNGQFTKSGFRKNGIEGEGFYGQNDKGQWGYFNDYEKTDPIEGTFANGILEGPVTYTGLAMLHGTPDQPEYVLNNDQAYNLLRYITTKKMPEFSSTNANTSGIQYIVEGDIVLEGVDNPQEFWGEVTKAMGNRWNVTKNR